MYIVIHKEAVPIKNNNMVASAIVITAATTIIAPSHIVAMTAASITGPNGGESIIT